MDRGETALELERELVRLNSLVAATVYPFLGLGAVAKDVLDGIAVAVLTDGLAPILRRFRLSVAGCEGLRDGAAVVAWPPPEKGEWRLYLDPVEGTLNGARGGKRCVAVASVDFAPEDGRLPLEDHDDVFFFGTASENPSPTPEGLLAAMKDDFRRGELRIGSLNRTDNRAYLAAEFGLGPPFEVIQRSGYQPDLLGQRVFMPGDSTILLPFEVEAGIGRVGRLESMIEASLWKSWAGLLVSKEKIRTYPTGAAAYIKDYLRAAGTTNLDKVLQFLPLVTIERLLRADVPLGQITEPLTKMNYGVSADSLTVISGITGAWPSPFGISRGVDGVRDVPAEREVVVQHLSVRGGAPVTIDCTVSYEEISAACRTDAAARWFDVKSWAVLAESAEFAADPGVQRMADLERGLVAHTAQSR